MLIRRTPDAWFLAAASTISGAGQLITTKVAGSVNSLVGTQLGIVWASGLLLAGIVLAAGLAWRAPVTGLLVERSGRMILAGSCYFYAIAAYALAGPSSAFPALVIGGFGLACTTRAVQITHWLHDHQGVPRA